MVDFTPWTIVWCSLVERIDMKRVVTHESQPSTDGRDSTNHLPFVTCRMINNADNKSEKLD